MSQTQRGSFMLINREGELDVVYSRTELLALTQYIER